MATDTESKTASTATDSQRCSRPLPSPSGQVPPLSLSALQVISLPSPPSSSASMSSREAVCGMQWLGSINTRNELSASLITTSSQVASNCAPVARSTAETMTLG